MNSFMFLISSITKSFMKHMYSSFTPKRAKLARFCSTLATKVSLRAVLSLGYSEREEYQVCAMGRYVLKRVSPPTNLGYP